MRYTQWLEYPALGHGATTLDHAEKLTTGQVVHAKVNFLRGMETEFQAGMQCDINMFMWNIDQLN